MIAGLNSALLNHLPLRDPDCAAASANSTSQAGQACAFDKTSANSAAALQRVAGTAKNAGAVQQLDSAQKKLATDLRAALAKAGVKLAGAIEISVKADGSVGYTGTDGDKAAMKALLRADPRLAARVADQARQAMKLSTTLQQGAAIAQAAKQAGSPGGVMALYGSLMQQTSSTTNVVFSLSTTASSLTYPGSLAAKA